MSNHVPTCEVTLDEVVRDAVDGVFVLDRNRQVIVFSSECERLTGIDRASVLGMSCPCHELMECADQHGRSLDNVLCPALKIFNREIDDYKQRMTVRHRDGHRVGVETTYSPIRGEGGSVVGVVGIMRDVGTNGAAESDSGQSAACSSSPSTGEDAWACATPGGSNPADSIEPGLFSKMGPLDRKLSALERREILAALQETNGQRTLAAQRLGISRSRLYRRMEALGIDPRQIGPREIA